MTLDDSLRMNDSTQQPVIYLTMSFDGAGKCIIDSDNM